MSSSPASIRIDCKIVFILFFLGLCFDVIQAQQLTVEIINGSRGGRRQKIERLELLKLEKGMESIQAVDHPEPIATLGQLARQRNVPYMVRGKFQGVFYSEIIPPNKNIDQKVQLQVYDIDHKFKSQYIDQNILYVLKYIKEHLRVLLFYRFNNRSSKTFIERASSTKSPKGIYSSLPNNAKQIQASVSVGSGLSNIQWLKLDLQKPAQESITLDQRNGTVQYLLPYPLKPGKRIYQVSFYLPYNGDPIHIPIRAYYPLKNFIELLSETGDLKLKILESPKWTPNLKKSDPQEDVSDISGSLISLPQSLDSITLLVKAGSSSGEAIEANLSPGQARLRIGSPLSFAEKFFYALSALVLFLSVTHYILKKPDWLIRLWAKKKSMIQYQPEYLQSKKKA